MPYDEQIKNAEIIRSKRRTMCIEITPDGLVKIRIPFSVSDKEALDYLERNKDKVIKYLKKREKSPQSETIKPLSDDDKKKLKKEAEEYIPKRVEYYADLMKIKYGKISFRFQKTVWGSCTSKKNLSFNCLLMLTPIEVIDSVVVHELCHTFEMNHSKKFYKRVLGVFPNYYECRKWLKENGTALIKSAN